MIRSLFAVLAVVIGLSVGVHGQGASRFDCIVQTGHVGSDAIVTRTVRWYACSIGHDTTVHVAVTRPWFHQHCHRVDNLADGAVASCDAAAPFPPPAGKIAGPSKWKDHLKLIGYGTLGAVVITACVMGGGCGFLGGS